MLVARGFDTNANSAFYPLHKLRGHLQQMVTAKLRKNTILLHLNPIEGVLIAYSTDRSFPFSPSKVYQLLQITSLEIMFQAKWYFKRDYHYLRLSLNQSDEHVFCSKELSLIEFWLNEINAAKRFYQWLQNIQNLRYSLKGKSEQKFADSLINSVIQLTIPEVNLDSYKKQ